MRLTQNEMALLHWLGEEDYSRYSECHGKALDALVAAGLVQIHQSGKEDADIVYRSVSVTDKGRELLLRKG